MTGRQNCTLAQVVAFPDTWVSENKDDPGSTRKRKEKSKINFGQQVRCDENYTDSGFFKRRGQRLDHVRAGWCHAVMPQVEKACTNIGNKMANEFVPKCGVWDRTKN